MLLLFLLLLLYYVIVIVIVIVIIFIIIRFQWLTLTAAQPLWNGITSSAFILCNQRLNDLHRRTGQPAFMLNR